MAKTIWTHCSNCMTQQNHTYHKNLGWFCDRCGRLNKAVAMVAAIREVAKRYLEE